MKRQTILATVPGLDIRLTWYQPGEAMSAHVHDRHQVSWLLGGEMRETSGSRERDLLQVSRGVEPAGCSHANDYGPAGALILALNIDPDAGFGRDLAGLDDWVWSPAADAAPGEIIRIAAAMADGGVPVSLALSDLAACIAVSDEPRSARTPRFRPPGCAACVTPCASRAVIRRLPGWPTRPAFTGFISPAVLPATMAYRPAFTGCTASWDGRLPASCRVTARSRRPRPAALPTSRISRGPPGARPA